jgi:hypothetical protein
MSDFDAFAQMQFAHVARTRMSEGRPLQVAVVDPYIDEDMKQRFRRVFRTVEFIDSAHEAIDWRIY